MTTSGAPVVYMQLGRTRFYLQEIPEIFQEKGLPTGKDCRTGSVLFVSGRVLAQSWGWDGFPAEVRTEPRWAGCRDGNWIKSKEERFSRGLAWEDAWG